MKSPFPGMDPYLERHWRDVHTKLIAYGSDEFNRRLPEDLIARSIEIIDIRGGERLITVVEFLSPTNKQNEGIEAFAKKRHEFLSGGVNFVEIDLVREGDWRALINVRACPTKAITAYRAVIRVPGTPTDVYLHPFSIREPLPAIKIPLRTGEKPCVFPLQPLIEQAYVNGRYGRTLDYRKPCEPPLDSDDAVWADELLRVAGRR